MSERIKPLSQEMIERLVQANFDALATARKSPTTPWILRPEKRRKAIDLLNAPSPITKAKFTELMGFDATALVRWMKRPYTQGGREILGRFLQLLDEREEKS